MNAIVCVDNQYGMQFNHRRVSSDSIIIKDMIQLVEPQSLWIEPYSQLLFQNEQEYDSLFVTDTLPNPALKGYQFIESDDLSDATIEILVIYYFNRNYPSDLKLDVDLNSYTITEVTEFKGHSHDCITRVIYTHK